MLEAPIAEANAWRGSNLPPECWVQTLSPQMIEEIQAAVERCTRSGYAPATLTAEQFPLDRTGALLGSIYSELEDRRGFSVLRGWPVERFSYHHNLTAFCGLSAQLGRIVVQNYEGDRYVDVTDNAKPYSHQSRGYQSRALLPFHTDGAELVGLLCLGTSALGGKSLLVSATEAYNVVAAEHPEWLAVLRRGFFHHRRGQHDPGENPISQHRIPVFAFHADYLHCCYNRNPIEWVEREGVRLCEEERTVLDYFDSVLARPSMRVELDFRKGDMQFVNNYVILHSRTEYEDGQSQKRHLVRLWLEDPRGKREGESLLDLYVPGSSRFSRAQA